MDGYVSLEVSPYLAHDTAGTMQEVRGLWHAVDRPNLFIKIAGTSAGVPASEEMLYEDININITLLFSVRAYEAVAHAYVRAIGRRVADRKPVRQVASVASFFLRVCLISCAGSTIQGNIGAWTPENRTRPTSATKHGT
jgi:transaldolase